MAPSGSSSAPDGEAPEPPQRSTPQRSDRKRWIAACVLLGYVVFLCALGVIRGRPGPAGDASAFRLDDLLGPFDWLAAIGVAGLVEVAKFAVTGISVSVALGRPAADRGFLTSLGRIGLILLLGIGLAAIVKGITLWRVPGVVYLLAPLAGYTLGAWIGATCLRGVGAMLWLVPKLALLLVTLTVAAAALVLLAMDDAPLPFEMPRVTSAEKRRVADVIASRRQTGNGTQRFRLAERDVNFLIAAASEHSPVDAKAQVALAEGKVTGCASLKTPSPFSRLRYVNVEGACRLEVSEGRVSVGPESLRVGRVRVPKLILRMVTPVLLSEVRRDPDLGQLVAAVDSVRLSPGAVEATYRSGVRSKGLISSLLARLGQKPNASLETRLYFRHLVAEAETLPEGDERFAAFLSTALALARERSREGDPVLENRAATLALAILLGHPRVEELVGPVSDRDLRRTAALSVGRVTLRSRGDWTRHFFVSAGLALVSSESISDGVGLFKEEIDAGEGGSGFSFSDLLADRAGTLFALAATRDEASARQVQERLADGFQIDEIFPPAADLPEGILDPELETDYGGVGGRKYREIADEMERRLNTCAALHPG
ncbi:MAG: hypothetical protein ABIK89_21110 [Planctomycetota bacterium]